MSLQPEDQFQIPAETARVARAAFPTGNLYLEIADVLGQLYTNADFAPLFPRRGQPAIAPARLALATVLQFAEGLSDRQAADAVRSRIDWKYALGLELTDAGFDHTVLSEFRSRLVAGKAEPLLLDQLLAKCRELKLLKARGRQRTDSTHIIANVRTLNRLERVGETLRHALETLAVAAPEWLIGQQLPDDWFERYGRRVENYRLPKTDQERAELAATIGADGDRLLQLVESAEQLPWLREIPAVKTLRQVWEEQYLRLPDQIRLRELKELPAAAEQTASPYDTEARFGKKREVEWVGYKVQLTETCDHETPNLIVNVEATPATTPDDNILGQIHESLQGRDLLPDKHLVDKGYTDSRILVESQKKYGVSVIGPVADDPSWQARARNGFAKADFEVDWER